MALRTFATILVAFFSYVLSGQALACSATTACINEVFVSFNGTPQTMADEYIELRGPANMPIAEGTYFVTLEGDKNAGPGSVDSVIDLGGLSFGQNGFLVLLAQGNIYTVNSLASRYTSTAEGFSGLGMDEVPPRQRWFSDPGVTNYERPSATYLILTAPVRPGLNDDIDTVGGSGNPPRGDGFPDGPVWDSWTVIDSVGAADNPNGDFSYGAINFRTGGSSGIGITVPISTRPNYVGRFGDSFGSTAAAWVESGVPTGTRPNFFLGIAVPQGLQGKPLNHIGSSNTWLNIAPVNNLPATATINEDTPLPFAGNFSIVDTDAGSSQVEVTISATNGTFSLSQTTGLVFSAGDGVADATMTFQGTVRNVDNTQGGTINAALAGSSYTPTLDFNGSGSVTVNTNDLGNTGTTGAASDLDTLNITIDAVNDPPVFALGAVPASNEDAGAQTVAGVVTGIGPGGGADEAAQTAAVTDVAVTVVPGGLAFAAAPAIDAAGQLTYTAAANSNGTATVTVTVTDSGSNIAPSVNASTRNFTLTVNAVNDEPSFALAAGPAAVAEDAGLQTIAGFANTFDAGPADEDASQSVLRYDVSVTSTTGGLAFAQAPAVAADGTLTYASAPNSNGTAQVKIAVIDTGGIANGGDDTSQDLTFTISIDALDDAPTFTFALATATSDEDASTSLAGFATITNGGPDEASQVLTFALTADAGATVAFATAPALASTGTLTYVPAAHDNGSAAYQVTLSDGNTTTAPKPLTIAVAAVNDAPVVSIAGDPPAVPEESAAVSVAGFASFAPGPAGAADEAGQALVRYELTPVATTSGLTFSTAPAIDNAGTLTYSVAPNFSGTATFDAVAFDDGSGAAPNVNASAPARFSIVVDGVNDEPSFTAGPNQTIVEDAGAQSVAGWATAINDGDAGVTQGLVFDISFGGSLGFSAGPAIDPVTGTLTYRTAPDATGTSTVSVTLVDDGGTTGGGDNSSATAVFTITATPVNDTPDFTLAGNQTVASDAGAQTVAGFVTSVSNGGPDEASQTLTYNVTNDANALFAAQPTISGAGVLSYSPATGANGAATVSVTLSDDAGATSSPAKTFTITVTPPVDPAPRVTSITRASTNPASSSPVQFSVGFSENVTGVDPGDFALVATGTVTGQSITSVTCLTLSSCTVTVAIADGAGTLRLDLVDNDSIRDSANQPLGGAGAGNGSFTTGEAFTITIDGAGDNTPPTVVSVVRANPSPSPGPTVQFTVTFSEAVTGVGASDFQLTLTGSLATPAIATVSGGGSAYLVTVTTGTGIGTIRLDVVDDDSILDGGANPLGGVTTGNGAFTTGEVYAIDTINSIPIFRDGFENPPAP